jgi:hypothetical protein
MTGHEVNVTQVSMAVNSVPRCLVTTAVTHYDKLDFEAVVSKRGERRTGLQLMSLKAAQPRNNIMVRW